MNEENLRPRSGAYQLCIQELGCQDPNFQAAQVFALLSVEEALRELSGIPKVLLVTRRQPGAGPGGGGGQQLVR